MIAELLALATVLGGQQDTARFQQGVDYRIEARMEEGSDVLRGRARLRYTNRSGVALDTLWFHQHLNAFRPNSAWARRELAFGVRRFQELGPGEHAYERLTRAEAGGRAVTPVYPGAPDSTVVGLPLPAPLRPGETVEVRLVWDARLSTLPRRQGRRGRHYDFAQWYPRIAVYDSAGWQTQPLLPQGEFFGEFGTYDVTLDVAADQVIGATGVPVEGDPGWRGSEEPDHRRDVYPASAAEPLGLLDAATGTERKRVRWRAERVHHFAWSMSPEYLHEQGTAARGGPGGEAGEGTIAVHVLYQPGDTAWDDGVVVDRARDALLWFQDLIGPYPWPQLTVLHRIEPGGTEFPMLEMNGSPSQGLIAHETAHMWVHGILANNEFREGWLDEGFASFLDLWFLEERGQTGLWEGEMAAVRELELAGLAQPIATPGAEFRDPATYSRMTYTKTALVLRMLRWLVGEETMREILRDYYRAHALGHVTEADFRAAAERASGRELGWFFDQWLHTTRTLDYGVADATTARLPDGRWRTRARVVRSGEAWMPVTIEAGDARLRLESRERSQTVELLTTTRPAEVVLDPEGVLLDLDPSNDRSSVAGPP